MRIVAVNMNSAVDFKDSGFLAESMQFRRGKGQMRTKKPRKKRRIRTGQILLLFLLIGGIFFVVQKAFLFLISWDQLNIRTIEIKCAEGPTRNEATNFLSRKNAGNFFLVDVRSIQDALKKLPLVKDARVRKIFPTKLEVSITERTPAASIKTSSIELIDRDGIPIKRAGAAETRNLPLLMDSGLFQHDRQEKLKWAWECLDSLPEETRNRIGTIDLSREDKMIVSMKGVITKIILLRSQFAEALQYYQKIQPVLARYGAIDYVDLRFQDRIYLKTRTGPAAMTEPKSLEGVK